jgi:hypothetical protein
LGIDPVVLKIKDPGPPVVEFGAVTKLVVGITVVFWLLIEIVTALESLV